MRSRRSVTSGETRHARPSSSCILGVLEGGGISEAAGVGVSGGVGRVASERCGRSRSPRKRPPRAGDESSASGGREREGTTGVEKFESSTAAGNARAVTRAWVWHANVPGGPLGTKRNAAGGEQVVVVLLPGGENRRRTGRPGGRSNKAKSARCRRLGLRPTLRVGFEIHERYKVVHVLRCVRSLRSSSSRKAESGSPSGTLTAWASHPRWRRGTSDSVASAPGTARTPAVSPRSGSPRWRESAARSRSSTSG